MKTYKTTFIYHIAVCVFFLTLNTTVYAQQGTNEQLIGNWSFNEAASFNTIETSLKTRMDSIPALKSQMLSIYRGRQTYFGSDGSYKITLKDGRSNSGSWTITSEGHIQLKDPSGNTSSYSITALNTMQLVITPITSGTSKSIVKQWHFVKL